jgi:hypothetical protein
VAVATLGAVCKPPPDTSDDTGLVGVPTTEGSLAGTWGIVIEIATVIQLPIFGARNAGSQGGRLLHRTWNADTHSYTDTFKWCTYDVFEVEGTTTILDPDKRDKLAEVTFTSHVDHPTGKFDTDPIVVLWGVHNLPDPANTPLPNKDNYQQQPQSDWVWDEDEDGRPGVTLRTEGTVNGWGASLSRSVYSLDGTVTAPDKMRGLARFSRGNQSTVEASSSFALRESDSEPDPSPKFSWFDSIRLADNATCDDVRAAMGDGRLATHRPF